MKPEKSRKSIVVQVPTVSSPKVAHDELLSAGIVTYDEILASLKPKVASSIDKCDSCEINNPSNSRSKKTDKQSYHIPTPLSQTCKEPGDYFRIILADLGTPGKAPPLNPPEKPVEQQKYSVQKKGLSRTRKASLSQKKDRETSNVKQLILERMKRMSQKNIQRSSTGKTSYDRAFKPGAGKVKNDTILAQGTFGPAPSLPPKKKIRKKTKKKMASTLFMDPNTKKKQSIKKRKKKKTKSAPRASLSTIQLASKAKTPVAFDIYNLNDPEVNRLLAWSGANQTSPKRTEHNAIEMTSCDANGDNVSVKVATSHHQGKRVTEGSQESGYNVSFTSSNEELHTNHEIPKCSSAVLSTVSLNSSSLTTKLTDPRLLNPVVHDSPEIDQAVINSCFVHLGETGVLRPRSTEQSSQLVVATNTSNTGCIRLKKQTHIKESARIDYHLRTCNNPRPNILKSKRRLTEFSTRFASLGLGRSENIEKKLSSPVYTPWKQKENFQNNKLSIIQRMNILKQKQPSLHRKREARYLLSPRKQ